ncbi:MAG: hypothetical protein EOO07_25580 [Chitinophagaceae bacterium]|nr:MAG: hypothetical protein EOO07_25580 [Chitinophagaceae bacterium]
MQEIDYTDSAQAQKLVKGKVATILKELDGIKRFHAEYIVQCVGEELKESFATEEASLFYRSPATT